MRWFHAAGRNRKWLNDRYSGLVINVPDKNVQYFAIPKVACSSLMAALVPAIGVSFPSTEWLPELFQTRKWDHLYERQKFVLTKRRALELQDCWRFAFVRNPWDRLVSCYSEKIRPNGDQENFVEGVSRVLIPFRVFHAEMSFEDFALAAVQFDDASADPHWRSQYTFLVDRRDAIAMDFVGRFERLPDDLQHVRDHLGGSLEMPHLLNSNRGPYRDYYSTSLRRVVAERYSRDIDLFGYEF